MTEDTAQVRLFFIADTSAVREIIVAGLTERWGTYDRHLNPDLEDFTNFYSACVVLVAERKRRIIGVGVLQPTSGSAAQVVRMSVAHDCRRQGIGTLVLHRLLQEASDRGLSEVSLETTASWSSAVEFYEHRGFVRTKILNGNQYFALRENAG